MNLHPAQSQIAKDKTRFRVVNCGRRFGKTLLSAWEMFAFAIADKDRKVAYIAPTYQQARDITWAQLKKICEPVTISTNEQRLEIIVKTTKGGSSSIVLRGWESVDSLRGQSFHFLVLDEVSSYRNFWMHWQEVLRPTLTDFRGQGLFISTPKGFNHFYDLFNLQNTDDDYKSFNFSTYDNPHIPKDEVDKAKIELTEDRFAQEYMADFRKTEGLVYKEFDRNRHIYEGDVENVSEYLGGIDFGFTNPCAVLHIYKDYDNNYFIADEWYKTRRTEAQIADYVRSCNFNGVYADPENPSAIEVLNNKGIDCREVIKGKGSVQSGINKVRSLLKRNKIKIHKNCVNIIGELETYSYPDKKANHNEEENPIKENDHAMDALRYVIANNIPDDKDFDNRLLIMQQARRRNLTNRAR